MVILCMNCLCSHFQRTMCPLFGLVLFLHLCNDISWKVFYVVWRSTNFNVIVWDFSLFHSHFSNTSFLLYFANITVYTRLEMRETLILLHFEKHSSLDPYVLILWKIDWGILLRCRCRFSRSGGAKLPRGFCWSRGHALSNKALEQSCSTETWGGHRGTVNFSSGHIKKT